MMDGSTIITAAIAGCVGLVGAFTGYCGNRYQTNRNAVKEEKNAETGSLSTMFTAAVAGQNAHILTLLEEVKTANVEGRELRKQFDEERTRRLDAERHFEEVRLQMALKDIEMEEMKRDIATLKEREELCGERVAALEEKVRQNMKEQ